MKIKLSKAKIVLMVVAMILSTVIYVADMAYYVISYDLYNLFPHNTAAVNFMISGPALIIVFSSFFASWLMKYFSKKTIMIGGGVLFAVSMIPCGMIINVWWMVACRILCGISQGIVNVTVLSLANDVFDENVYAKVVGYYNSGMSLVGAVLSYGAGVLAAKGWQNMFNIYWVSVPMLILFFIGLPYLKLERVNVEQTQERQANQKENYSLKFWMTFVSLVIFYIAFCAVNMLIALYVEENGLGTTVFTGTLTSISTIGMMVFGLVYGVLYDKGAMKLYKIGILIAAVSIMAMYYMPNRGVAIIGEVILSCVYFYAFSSSFVYCPTIAPASRAGDVIAIGTAVCAIGNFAGTYVATALMMLLHTDGKLTPVFPGIAVIFIISFVFAMLFIHDAKTVES